MLIHLIERRSFIQENPFFMLKICYCACVLLCLSGCVNKSDPSHDHFKTGTEDYLNESRFILDSLITGRNYDQLAELYGESAVCLFGEMDEVSGKENIRSMYKELFNSMDTVFIRSKVIEIMQENQWAMERSIYTFRFKPKGSMNMEYRSGRVVTTFHENKGKWEIVWQISNNSPVREADYSSVKKAIY